MSKGCYEVRGKTLGIVGYGHIGSQVGVLAEMLGMKVKFFDIASKVITRATCSPYTGKRCNMRHAYILNCIFCY